MNDESNSSSQVDQFCQESQQGRSTLWGEFVAFLKYNKKWWLIPILVMMVLLGSLMFFSGSAAAPFIYALF